MNCASVPKPTRQPDKPPATAGCNPPDMPIPALHNGRKQRIFPLAWALLLVAAALAPGGCGSREARPRVRIGQWIWFVDVAATRQGRYQGLAGRTHLADNTGMLFVYPRETVLLFCMRRCAVPIDIAFIDRDLRVVKVTTMVVEPDRAGRWEYSSDTPAQYALEVAGGLFARRRIRPGDKVTLLGNIPPATKAEP